MLNATNTSQNPTEIIPSTTTGTPIEVYNFTDGHNPSLAAVYHGITPYDAVIACYAQDLGDFNTWDYHKKYAKLVRIHAHSVSCGPFSALI